jgi:hypothetical protein
MKPKRRRKRGAFNLAAIRRGQIERHAREIGAADTEDFWRWLVAWCWHNRHNGHDPAGALEFAAERMGASNCLEMDMEAILESADAMVQRRSADRLAQFLGVTYAQRERLGLTTIGSVDVDRKQRAMLRKRKGRLYQERRRRGRGAKPQSKSLSRTKPWKLDGISRAAWYRKRRETTSSAAIPPLSAPNETTSSAAFLSMGVDETVSRKQGAVRGGACAPSTARLTRRWLAARERLCDKRKQS